MNRSLFKRVDGWCKSARLFMNSPLSCKCEGIVMLAVFRVKDNEASDFVTNVGGTAGDFIHNPLVPFWDGSFFIFKNKALLNDNTDFYTC